MKDLDLGALFCEVLSGFVCLLVVAMWLDATGNVLMMTLLAILRAHLSLSSVTSLLLLSYLLGLFVDALGLLADRVLVKTFWPLLGFADEVTPSTSFYGAIPAHMLSYMKEHWAYYSCYRNLVVLTLLGCAPFFWLVYLHAGCVAMGVAGIAFLVVLGSLIASCKETWAAYNRIVGSF